MNKKNFISWIIIFIFGAAIGYFLNKNKITYYIFITLILVEIIFYLTIKILHIKSPLILTKEDEKPELNWQGLLKFFKHGYDPELGWIRKQNTHKIEKGKLGDSSYTINKKGARTNPCFENKVVEISCYGDSFTFCRQVNDNETWEYYLSQLTGSNVQNFGVGNYGFDQALIRLKRELKNNKTKIVIIGIVPSTIIRILAMWKHYHDYGNTFGFKPVYIIEKDKLKLIPNQIDTEEKFLHYDNFLSFIQKHDYFYKNKFKLDLLEFPYTISILLNPIKNFISLVYAFVSPIRRDRKKQKKNKLLKTLQSLNLRFFPLQSAILFKKKYPTRLLQKLIEEFHKLGEKNNFIPVLLWMPQKEDIISMKKHGIYYSNFVKSIKKKIKLIDLTEWLMNSNKLNELYTDDSKYGGHFSPQGNKKIAKIIFQGLKKMNIICN